MKTKEFIEILQKADPSGEAHIRMPDGGIPYYAELKPGYWDGPYSYLDENGKWIYTIEGNKVDVWQRDKYDFVWEIVEDTNPWIITKEEAWELVKSKFDVRMGGYAIESQRNDRVDGFFKGVKEPFEDAWEHHRPHWDVWLEKDIEKVKKGYRFFQREESLRINEFIIMNDKGKFEVGTNYGTSRPIYDSGKFIRSDKPISGYDLLPSPKKGFLNRFTKKPYKKEVYEANYYEWILKE